MRFPDTLVASNELEPWYYLPVANTLVLLTNLTGQGYAP